MQDNPLGATAAGTGSAETDETDRLIASNKVEGTAVYNRQGERLGSVYNFMVDKRSGQVEYAVLSFGGFLGIGDSYYPLPWKSLKYDTGQGGYVVDLDKDRLQECAQLRAPATTRTGATRATGAGSTTTTARSSRASSGRRVATLGDLVGQGWDIKHLEIRCTQYHCMAG